MSKKHSQDKTLTLPLKPSGRAPFAVELLEPSPNDNVLNIGCFNGGLEYHFLLGRVKEFHGIDLNTEAVLYSQNWSQKILGKKDSFQVAAAESLPFGDSTFDKIICLDTFEHVQNEQKVADEIFRVLKPGGTVVLSVPHDFLNFLDPDDLTRDLRNIVRKYVRKKPLLDHPKHRHYDEQALRSFFSKFKFEYVHKCGTPVFWTLAMLYTGVGLPERIVNKLSTLTSALENLEYRTKLPTGFNIMIRMKKPSQ